MWRRIEVLVPSETRRGPIIRLPRSLLALLVLVGSTSGDLAGARAQTPYRSTVPTDYYFGVLGDMYDGDYPGALREFQSCLRGSVKTAQSYWIDSICYNTMCGECNYQMGQYAAALDYYGKALQLATTFNDWMVPVQFPATITPSTSNVMRTIPWGVSQRQAALGHFSDTVSIKQATVDPKTAAALGAIAQSVLFPINPQEIVRCTCLALRRRRELMGPTAQYDALTNQVITLLSKRPVRPNHWSEAWLDIELACAFSAVGKDAQAKPIFERALLAGGQYDHPLTCVALLELGRIALGSGDFDLATRFFEEASYSAYQYFDPIILEDAFRYGAITHFVANRPGAIPCLPTAYEWARREELRQLQAVLISLMVENSCLNGDAKSGSVLLDNVRVVTNRTSIMNGRVGAHLNFVAAHCHYQLGNVVAGDAEVNDALAFCRVGSMRLFQLGLAQQQLLGRMITSRMGKDVFELLLRDPVPGDWLFDPLETTAMLAIPHPLYFETWFELSLDNKELDGKRALEIVDLAKRHKFLSTQELGGRLLNLRWTLEAPAEMLNEKIMLQRQTLLTQFPEYEKLSQKARDIRLRLSQLPLTTEDAAAAKQQATELAELDKISQAQEIMLKVMSVRRAPADLVFPPVRTVDEVQRELPLGSAVLSFYAGARGTYGFLMTNERYGYWPIQAVPEIQKKTIALLQGLGNYEENKPMRAVDLHSTGWRQTAKDLFDLLIKDSKSDLPYGFTEVAIVPDGGLWYVPFEALEASPRGEAPKSLLSLVRLRYAPTMGLAVPDKRPRLDKGNSLIAVGKLYPTDVDAVGEQAFADISRAVPQPGQIKPKTKLPSSGATFASLADRYIGLIDLQPSQNGYYQWNPLTGDRGAPGGTMADWLRLPWHGPEQVALPGFHTHAENGLKSLQAADAGQEVFLSTTSLMAGGARTILISRWRPGGRTSYDLVREFMQELPFTSAAKAWQRSVALAQQTPIDPEAEPRLRLDPNDVPPKAEHPFFWAAYMIVDSGSDPDAKLADPPKDPTDVIPKDPAAAPAAGAVPPPGLVPPPVVPPAGAGAAPPAAPGKPGPAAKP